MAISEVNAVVNFVVKATSFIAQLQDGWYKGSVELHTLQTKIWVLGAKHGQWNEQMLRYGISEDKYLLPLVQETDKALESFRSKVEKLQKSAFRRLKKKVFPGQLLYLVDKIYEIVDAAPQVLATRVANSDVLDKYLAQTPASLPFGSDRNYVPIAESILAVRNALENSEGPRVVTLYGGPGTGKSSLLKSLAIYYQEERKRLGAEASFPHGVYYLFCGHHAGKRANQLVLELLQNLGCATRSIAGDDSTPNGTGLQDRDYLALHTNQMQLRSRLADQKSLIMVDDLWEAKVLPELLVPARGVKYLVTSQMRDICSTALKIPIRKPNLQECCQIMANYTDGLPQKGEFPDNIKSVAKDLSKMLQYHPLSLANIGISINGSRATDVKQWDVIKKYIYVYLDENESCSAAAHDRPYDLSVSASMMLMVESLSAEQRRLLFVMSLLEGPDLPESLVKYFYSFIQNDNFVVKYNHHQKFLEDKSLIESTVRGDSSLLNVHSLRAHYIREKNSLEVRSVSSQILCSIGDEVVATKAMKKWDAEETLASILSAVYYHKSFKDLVAGPLEKHIRLMNGEVIPRSLTTETEIFGLVESARGKHDDIKDLVRFLNADHKVDNWERQAHESAKKIIIKFVCQGKLEDKSMARLLRLPQTTTAACEALTALCVWHEEDFYDRNSAFSEAYPATMQTLLDLFEYDAISTNQRRGVIVSVLSVLSYERKDYIRTFVTKYGNLSAMKSECFLHSLRDLSERLVFCETRSRGLLMLVEFGGLLENIIAELVELGNSNLTDYVESRRDVLLLDVIEKFCTRRDLALKIAAFPEALQTLFYFLSSDDLLAFHDLRRHAGIALHRLSVVPENRIKVGAIEGVWNGLVGILTTLKDIWWATPKWKDRLKVAERAERAAAILGFLALEKNFRDTVISLRGVKEALFFLQLVDMAKAYVSNRENCISHSTVKFRFSSSTGALMTVFREEPGDSKATFLPSMADILNLVLCCHEGASSMISSVIVESCYLSLYWTQVRGLMLMGSYGEALQILDRDVIPRAKRCLNSYDSLLLETSFGYAYNIDDQALRDWRIFLQTMAKDYTLALVGANKRVEESEGHLWVWLTERGVLKRLHGDLQGALKDLVAATACVTFTHGKHQLLWQRGYVKWLMGDMMGAEDDAQAAQAAQRCHQLWCPDSCENGIGMTFWLCEIPVTYLGYSSN